VGLLSRFFLKPTEHSFDSALRIVQVSLFSDLLAQYSSEMDSGVAATLAAQVTNFLKGEDIVEIGRAADEPLRTQISSVLPQVPSRAHAKMVADLATREIVVATLRMYSVLMFSKHGKAWFGSPAKDRIENILGRYGYEFPEEISPPIYEHMAAGYCLLKHPT
jgi:hypothetical protein